MCACGVGGESLKANGGVTCNRAATQTNRHTVDACVCHCDDGAVRIQLDVRAADVERTGSVDVCSLTPCGCETNDVRAATVNT